MKIEIEIFGVMQLISCNGHTFV